MEIGNAQVGIKAETTYGTAVVVDRFFPFIEDGIEPDFGVASAVDEQRAGSIVERVDQDDPYVMGASGSFSLYVPTKGFGLLISHAMGAIATTGPTDSNSTHTGTLSASGKLGKSITYQGVRPFNPAGTAQPITFEGGKIISMELTLEEGDYLKATFELDFEDVATATALATASYLSIAVGGSKFPWRLATITIAGSQVEVKSFRCKVTWPMNVDRRFIRGSALKKEPVPNGKPTIDWDMEVEFTDLTQYNRVAASTIANRIAAIVLTAQGAVALAGATVPQLTLTLPAARFDSGLPTISGDEGLMQSLSGIALDDGTNQPISVAYRTPDATP